MRAVIRRALWQFVQVAPAFRMWTCLGCAWICGPAYGQDPGTNIAPQFTVAPTVYVVGRPSDMQLTWTNANHGALQKLLAGDSFVYSFAIQGVTVESVRPTAAVGSEKLRSEDFEVALDKDRNELRLLYNGPAVALGATESITVHLVVRFQRVTSNFKIPASRFARAGRSETVRSAHHR